jgi:hypothetical protein
MRLLWSHELLALSLQTAHRLEIMSQVNCLHGYSSSIIGLVYYYPRRVPMCGNMGRSNTRAKTRNVGIVRNEYNKERSVVALPARVFPKTS